MDKEKQQIQKQSQPLVATNITENPSARARQMLGCLYTSLLLSSGVLALSMLHMGFLSLFMAPIAAFFTMIFSVTFIVFTHKDFNRRRQGLPKPGLDPGYDKHIWLLRIVRGPSIATALFLISIWFVSFGIEASVVSDMALTNAGPVDFNGGIARNAIPVMATSTMMASIEVGLMGLQILVLVTLSLMSMNERTAITRQVWLGTAYKP
ncbi:hypothetical protein FA15DRAFT_722822 [Coprinopsis marcescibilis]|uniref:Uncharacterized protein n=1 Tax=Coprinopsis marcescibilis TaxID=230819 RepID=A0A5C3KI37_COPMA|nr:hypothetical protein FA15DRAFT_722822 [Coprinopsis marcescibilis]